MDVNTVHIGLYFVQITQLLIFVALSFFYKRIEFRYYTVYVACSTIYILGMSYWFEQVYPDTFPARFFLIFDKPFAFLSYFFYFRFAKYFLDIPREQVNLNKRIRRIEWVLLGFSISMFALIPFLSQELGEGLYAFYSVVTIVLSLIAVYLFLRSGKKSLNSFVVLGAVLILGAAITTFVMMQLQFRFNWFENYHAPLQYHIFLILELIVFSIGLGYKAHYIENQKQSLDKKLILQMQNEERIQKDLLLVKDKFASDIHDDIASSLTAIEMLAKMNLAKKYGDKSSSILRISQELLGNLRDSIWVLSSSNLNIHQIFERIQNQWEEVLRVNQISFKPIYTPLKIEHTLSLTQTRNLLLILKEVINNCLKHAACSSITAEVTLINEELQLKLSDDGSFKPKSEDVHLGMQNIINRTKLLQGRVEVHQELGFPVSYKLYIPLK